MSNIFARLKHPQKDVQRIFGPKASTKAAAELFKTNRPLYDELREDAVTLGYIGEASYFRPGVDDVKPERTFSNVEIRARAEFTEQECREWYLRSGAEGNQNNLGKLKETDPERYERLRTAAISHGVIPKTPSMVAPGAKNGPAVPVDDGRIVIPASLAERAHLPADLRVSQDDITKITEAVSQAETAKKVAALRADAETVQEKK